MLRGYLWENLEREIAAEFAQAHPFMQMLSAVPTGWNTCHIESELGYVREQGVRLEPVKSTAAVRSLRELRRSKGSCVHCDLPRAPDSKTFCAAHREKDRARAEEKRRRAGKPVRGRYMKEHGMQEAEKKLPVDREGVTLHFKILSRGEEQADGSAEVRQVDGYLTMNVNPDGKTLREIFVRVGKPGSSDALYDELAKQASNRLQEGASVEDVFRTHVGTQFGDRGRVLRVKNITSCTSVLDLIARIILSKFGKEAA